MVGARCTYRPYSPQSYPQYVSELALKTEIKQGGNQLRGLGGFEPPPSTWHLKQLLWWLPDARNQEVVSGDSNPRRAHNVKEKFWWMVLAAPTDLQTLNSSLDALVSVRKRTGIKKRSKRLRDLGGIELPPGTQPLSSAFNAGARYERYEEVLGDSNLRRARDSLSSTPFMTGARLAEEVLGESNPCRAHDSKDEEPWIDGARDEGCPPGYERWLEGGIKTIQESVERSRGIRTPAGHIYLQTSIMVGAQERRIKEGDSCPMSLGDSNPRWAHHIENAHKLWCPNFVLMGGFPIVHPWHWVGVKCGNKNGAEETRDLGGIEPPLPYDMNEGGCPVRLETVTSLNSSLNTLASVNELAVKDGIKRRHRD
ncbi:hypothetical protein DFH09DRAFT_1102647 [Mycena vulgaris]|nr:hypothetical protein DFH09DRAFT_1102647 [Mycena vulgaris]